MISIETPSSAEMIATSTHDCSLVVAVPLDEDAFIHDLRFGPEGNFAKSFRDDGRAALPDTTVALAYKPYADLAQEVIRDVAQLGVKVIVNARLSDFADLIKAFRVTTIIAHWRDSRFWPSDIANHAFILAEIQRQGSPFAMTVGELMTTLPNQPRPTVDSALSETVDFLNRLLRANATASNGKGEAQRHLGALTRQQYEWHTRRRLLEQALPESFRGGAGLEFVDCFQVVDQILSTVPTDYAGTLDLTVCNSTVLAEEVRRKCRRCLVLANEQPATLDFRFAVYRQVIRSLARRSEPYEEAMFRIRNQVVLRRK
jgi:hypothetical protein